MPKIGPKGISALGNIANVYGEILEAMAGPTTATIYKLDPAGLLPIEPLVDIIPTVSPNRQSVDVVLSSSHTESYSVTRNAIQRGFDTTSHVKKQLAQVSITGIISGAPLLAIAGAIGAALGALNSSGAVDVNPRLQSIGAQVPGFPSPRRDLLQLQMLRLLADQRKPVMLATPDFALPRCIITRISRSNGAEVGIGTEVVIDFIEARIIAPQFTDAIPDLDAVLNGNSSAVDAGGQPATAVQAPPDLSGGLG